MVGRNSPDEPNQPDKQNKPDQPDRPDRVPMNRVLAVWRSVGQESLNLPNFITLTRILLIPVFVLLFTAPTPNRSLSAALVFVVAAVTDMLDGYLARRNGQVTTLGK